MHFTLFSISFADTNTKITVSNYHYWSTVFI